MFDIYKVVENVRAKRKIFVSEADFQLEFGWAIKELYPDAKVRLEYCPEFDPKMHIDILVIMGNKWIPIELKYKTKACDKFADGERFILKEHGAKDVNCYLYLKDLCRLEAIRKNVIEFSSGYAVFLTNEMSYTRAPMKVDCVYKEFSLEEGVTKHGALDWSENASSGTKKNNEKPIILSDKYKIEWQDYSHLDESKTGHFKILINKVV